MQFLVYIIAYPLLWLIALLPFRILYFLSDIAYGITYYLIGYRKKTVRENLALTFPHLSEKERLIIEKKSYRHMCDMFLEMIKTMKISRKQINKRFVFTNMEVYREVESKNKSIILMCAHYASYEWVISMNNYINFEGYAVYKKINNKHFDGLVKKIRGRFKTHLIHIFETASVIRSNENKGIKGIYGLAADQSPQLKKNSHWEKFLGIEVPVYAGGEVLSKKFDMNVLYLKVEKVKRGHYQATFEVLTDDVQSLPKFELTKQYLQKVEQQIHQAPEYYLWTHKRWKHRGKKDLYNNLGSFKF